MLCGVSEFEFMRNNTDGRGHRDDVGAPLDSVVDCLWLCESL